MTDFLSALRAYLLGCQAVTVLLNSDVNVGPTQSVYVLALPAEEIATGKAHKIVVLLSSGGSLGKMRNSITEARVDIVCYGETDFEAAKLDRAVAESAKQLQRQLYLNVLLHGATVASGPLQARDPELFWPAVRRQYILRADEREVG